MRTVPQISPDTVLHLLLPERHADQEEVRSYSLEELRELLNKLMLMSGKKDHNSTEVEVFSEVRALGHSPPPVGAGMPCRAAWGKRQAFESGSALLWPPWGMEPVSAGLAVHGGTEPLVCGSFLGPAACCHEGGEFLEK